MKQFLGNLANRVAPRTFTNLRRLNTLEPEFDGALTRLLSYERELRELRREVDELRRENRRVAELYDVFFHWAQVNAGWQAPKSRPDTPETVSRVGEVLSRDA